MTSRDSFVVHPRDGQTRIGTLLVSKWGLQLSCRACRRVVKWYSETLETFPVEATLGELAARAKCDDCGSRDGVIQVINDPGSVQRANLDRFVRDRS